MIELIFTACLLVEVDTCREDRLVYTGIAPTTCMAGAQAQLARWADGHPRWAIARWRCVPVAPGSKEI